MIYSPSYFIQFWFLCLPCWLPVHLVHFTRVIWFCSPSPYLRLVLRRTARGGARAAFGRRGGPTARRDWVTRGAFRKDAFWFTYALLLTTVWFGWTAGRPGYARSSDGGFRLHLLPPTCPPALFYHPFARKDPTCYHLTFSGHPTGCRLTQLHRTTPALFETDRVPPFLHRSWPGSCAPRQRITTLPVERDASSPGHRAHTRTGRAHLGLDVHPPPGHSRAEHASRCPHPGTAWLFLPAPYLDFRAARYTFAAHCAYLTAQLPPFPARL